MSQLARKLYQLQALDLELREQLSRLKEKEGLLGETDELRAAKASLDDGQRDVTAKKSLARDLEFELEQTTDKLRNTEARLYGGGVSNPKELHGMQQDQEYLQRARARYEDETLQALDALELAESELAVRSKRLTEVHLAWERAQSDLAGQVDVLRSRVAELKGQRSNLAAGLDSSSMKLYQEILRKKGDRAVALLVGQTCQGCRVTMPTGKAQEARKSATLALCSNCGRILVAE